MAKCQFENVFGNKLPDCLGTTHKDKRRGTKYCEVCQKEKIRRLSVIAKNNGRKPLSYDENGRVFVVQTCIRCGRDGRVDQGCVCYDCKETEHSLPDLSAFKFDNVLSLQSLPPTKFAKRINRIIVEGNFILGGIR